MTAVPTISQAKQLLRRELRGALASIPRDIQHTLSMRAAQRLTESPEFRAARSVMVFVSLANEIDTSQIALRCWQEGKQVLLPRVSWDQRRILPVEVSSFGPDQVELVEHGPNRVAVPDPFAGKPVPIDMVDLCVVPGLGFTASGMRIGRGMGFYDRFLRHPDFSGIACGLAFEQQVVSEMPVSEDDTPLSMLVTDEQIRRFSAYCMEG